MHRFKFGRPKPEHMSEKAWEQQLSMQLEKTNALLRALLRLNFETLEAPMSDKIIILDGLGMAPSEIAEILGTSSNSVSVTLSKLRKKEKGGREDAKETPNSSV